MRGVAVVGGGGKVSSDDAALVVLQKDIMRDASSMIRVMCAATRGLSL